MRSISLAGSLRRAPTRDVGPGTLRASEPPSTSFGFKSAQEMPSAAVLGCTQPAQMDRLRRSLPITRSLSGRPLGGRGQWHEAGTMPGHTGGATSLGAVPSGARSTGRLALQASGRSHLSAETLQSEAAR